jgi:pyruvate dehydrogenase E1 component beta subunit
VDAFRLLRAAAASDDPVIYLEPKSRYWSREPADLDGDGGLPIGRARAVRRGSDATLIAYGAMVARCLEAAEAAAEEGVELTVLDLRSLVPLDLEGLAEAVRATGRAVVVHEAPMTLGFGAELVARIVEDCFDALEAPVLRVTGFDTPYPPATLESHHVPSVDRILDAVERTLTY